MTDDLRCCGSGTCIINAQGLCWCGQQWDGDTMRRAPVTPARPTDAQAKPLSPDTPSDTDTRKR